MPTRLIVAYSLMALLIVFFVALVAHYRIKKKRDYEMRYLNKGR